MRLKIVLLNLLLSVGAAAGAAEVTNALSAAFAFRPSGAPAAAADSDGFGFVAPGLAAVRGSSAGFGYVTSGGCVADASAPMFGFVTPGCVAVEASSRLFGFAPPGQAAAEGLSSPFSFALPGDTLVSASSGSFCFALPGDTLASASSGAFGFALPGTVVASASSPTASYLPAGTTLVSASSEPFAFGETTVDMILRTLFDGIGDVSRTTDGYRVSLTNDFTGTLVFPDNLGRVEIDLAGHDLRGPEGAAAVVVEASGAEGLATMLVFIDSHPDAGVDIVGGPGGPGILLASDIRDGVGVELGADVTLAGGAGAKPVEGGVAMGPGTVVRTVVPVPDIAAKTYDATHQIAAIPTSSWYDVTNTGGTDAGSYDVMLTLTDPANCRWPDSDAAETNLTFAILPRSGVTVSVVGHSETVDRDGLVHTVSGWDFACDDALYQRDFVQCALPATASGLEVGSYPMGLTSAAFTNLNDNFAAVAFAVTDGVLTIAMPNVVTFRTNAVVVAEGDALALEILGGNPSNAVSASVALTCQTAAATDLDLARGTVDGVTPKGGLKFPLTLTWEAGGAAKRTIAIPVKADKTIESDETLIVQLTDVRGAELGWETACIVLIRDANVATDYAAKQAKTTVKTKKGCADNYDLTVSCAARDGSDDVCGYTSGQGTYYSGCKALLKATARPGWSFGGWGEIAEDVTNVVCGKASWNVTVTDDVAFVAFFDRIPCVTGVAMPAGAGKVTGAGYCASGKKLTLTATSTKGFSFVGWWPADVAARAESAGSLLPDGEPLSRQPKLVLADLTDDLSLVAWYVPAAADAASIAVTVDGLDIPGSDDGSIVCSTNVWAGVRLDWPVVASAWSVPSVKVAGLPGGLGFADGRIVGVPAAASRTTRAKDGSVSVSPSVVKITVTTSGGNVRTHRFALVVDPLPSWTVGTFAGPSYELGPGEPTATTNGASSVTVAANGKITARQPVNGRQTSFTANGFDRYDASDAAFAATLTAKIGKETVTNRLSVWREVMLADGGALVVTNGVIFADGFDAWQYNWKAEPWKTIVKSFGSRTFAYVQKADGTISESDDDVASALGESVVAKVTLKIATSGVVTVKGEFVTGYNEKKLRFETTKATGSATLLPVMADDGDVRYVVFIYLSPKGIPPHVRCVDVAK